MLNKLSSTNFHLRLFKTLLLTANAAGLIIYLFVHLIFFDFPFDAMYELSVLLKMFAVATSFALAVCLLVILADAADFFSLLIPALVIASKPPQTTERHGQRFREFDTAISAPILS